MASMISQGTQTRPNLPRPFDVNSEQHDIELREWCRLHFQLTLCKGINSFNAPTYHDCCLVFSRKGCVKRTSHPKLQSASVLKIPTLKFASTHEDLYRWLKDRLRLHHRLGKKTFFPSINTSHFNEEDDYSEDVSDEPECLGKRFDKNCHELEHARQEISKLKDENQRLLNSSKVWCQKYQDLLYKEDETPSYAKITPFKSTTKDISYFLEL